MFMPNSSPSPTCDVIGTPLAVLDYEKAVAIARAWASEPAEARTIAAANTHVVTLARHDQQFGAALARFDLVLPDGMPLVWAMNRRCGVQMRDRVYGPTFMLRCLEATQDGSLQHFLLGGSDELLGTLRQRLREKFPGLQIAGVYAPPFGDWSNEEDDPIFEKIAASGAGFVWVGLGCPKQELWISRNKARLPPAVYCAVGAAFAFHAGRVRQAPAWMQNAGLEWIFRLAAEPRRLWRRYVLFNSLFLFYLTADKIRGR
ncbi:MAG: N-acetylglucosaminyldiphosphoundecaprenol N-acetyl-beta-D-mannosaminyltransferase [Chthoniobacter sp.]|nr:N-acetylglucosaminyldiphosphoundecaprenol N-acetyl-beta-D-mannosaminyltransferase [Chthoniobacter sp.]